jgi:hypothetical protein
MTAPFAHLTSDVSRERLNGLLADARSNRRPRNSRLPQIAQRGPHLGRRDLRQKLPSPTREPMSRKKRGIIKFSIPQMAETKVDHLLNAHYSREIPVRSGWEWPNKFKTLLGGSSSFQIDMRSIPSFIFSPNI